MLFGRPQALTCFEVEEEALVRFPELRCTLSVALCKDGNKLKIEILVLV